MKKNVLALSIAAAVASFGVMGSAHAITTIIPGAAAALSKSDTGVGHVLVVPYYTAQGTNATLINLTNTDPTNGKAVKVRFRGAANSDDVYDFQVFLSPSDMWTAKISVGASGVAQIETADVSCTKPAFKAGVPQAFSTLRVDPTPVGSTAVKQTLEGYVEIFNMADIRPTGAFYTVISGTGVNSAASGWLTAAGTNPLYTAIKHVANVAPCSGAAFTALDTDQANWGTLTYPTTGLAANWTIINLQTAAAFGGQASAIQAVTAGGAPTTGNIVYWPQTKAVFGNWPSATFTADPLLAGSLVTGVGTYTAVAVPAVLPLLQDLPDLSTPYYAGVTAAQQAEAIAASIAARSFNNEFLVDSAALTIGAATDMVVSMPTRRYAVAMNYTSGAAIYNPAVGSHFSIANTTVTNRQVCVFGLSPAAYNREESTPSLVVSSPSSIPTFCGETSVIGVNQTAPTATNVLGATIAIQGMDVTYNEGWLTVATPGLGFGLPIIGDAFTKAAAGSSNFGVNFPHRVTR